MSKKYYLAIALVLVVGLALVSWLSMEEPLQAGENYGSLPRLVGKSYDGQKVVDVHSHGPGDTAVGINGWGGGVSVRGFIPLQDGDIGFAQPRKGGELIHGQAMLFAVIEDRFAEVHVDPSFSSV